MRAIAVIALAAWLVVGAVPDAAAQAPLPALPVQAPAAVADAVRPPGLPAIGKWMIDSDGNIAHWLGEIVDGKRLREPINVIVVDAAASNAGDAVRRLVAALATAGYPVRFGHSTGYRALIGDALRAQLPAGRDDAFSDGLFEISNNHGRLFGPAAMDGVYVFTGAFSREAVDPLRRPGHRYASFDRARDDVAHRLDRKTAFKLRGFVPLANAILGDPAVGTGDHDGLAVLLRAER